MTLQQWFVFFLVIQFIHGLGTWKLYIKAGRKAWEAFIPVYNAVVLIKILGRSVWWLPLLFLPIINLIMFPVIWVETARSFGKNTRTDTVLAVITLGFYNYYLNYVADVSYVENRDLSPRSNAGDWVSSILFAVVAATLVHTYFIQPYVIPSSSLEKSLLVGEFLFVSKFHYGARLPMTSVAAPMVHDTIPLVKKKSYLFDDDLTKQSSSWKNKLQLPYMRIPGFEKIDRNEIVVFNSPADTLYTMKAHAPVRNFNKPVDKKTNLVKRCVGIPGDTLEVRNGYVFINGVQNQLPDRAELQFGYYVQTKTGEFNPLQLANRYNITDVPVYSPDRRVAQFPGISDRSMARFKNHPNILGIQSLKQQEGNWNRGTFPHHPDYPWNNDYFGPIYIPEAGKTIDLNTKVLPLYKRLITVYEHNDLRVDGEDIYINGELVTTYTFKQDYYWMMGDNRHNSLDARAWGFTPFDHVVGKPVFIWMSWDSNAKGFNKIRWDRVFTTVHGSGDRVSYLLPFIGVLLLWWGIGKYRKRRAKS